MSLILRTTKGSPITNEELDGNFVFLDQQILQLDASLTLLADTTIPEAFDGVQLQLNQRQPINAKLTSLSGVATAGLLCINGDTVTPRQIVAGSANISISNADGIAGNPTIDITPLVVTTTGSQTITNKVISGAQNSLVNIPLSSAVAGVLSVANGGTGGATASAARTSLGVIRDPLVSGIIVRTSTDGSAARSIAVQGVGLSVANSNGALGNPTITINSTSSAVPNTVVARDGSGNFSAGTITAFLQGTAANANAVLNGVYTTGSYANPSWITSLAGSKVTSIPNSSLQNSTIQINGTPVALGGSINVPVDYLPNTPNSTPNTLVARNGSGNFSANEVTASVFRGTLIGNVQGNVAGNVIGSASLNVLKTGDVMTGPLQLSGMPTNPLHAASKQYVDTVVGVGAKVLGYATFTGLGTVTASLNITAVTRLSNGYYRIFFAPQIQASGIVPILSQHSRGGPNISGTAAFYTQTARVAAVTSTYADVEVYEQLFYSFDGGSDDNLEVTRFYHYAANAWTPISIAFVR